LRAGQGTSFIWRKLHSLLGIVPIGAFLLEHLLSNFEALKGPLAYGAQVKFLNSLPLVRVLEWVFIFLPILYHGLYGVYIWLRGKSNIVYYPWAGNWMYTRPALHRPDRLRLHRQHVARSASWASACLRIPARPSPRCSTSWPIPWMLAVYVIAMIAICWHFAYGVWLFAAKWGITPGETARASASATSAPPSASAGRHGTGQHLGVCRGKYPNAPENVPPLTGVRFQGSGISIRGYPIVLDQRVEVRPPSPEP
jgi:succinate dehydrogenase / fumarate reductase, cytochrome b subunit